MAILRLKVMFLPFSGSLKQIPIQKAIINGKIITFSRYFASFIDFLQNIIIK